MRQIRLDVTDDEYQSFQIAKAKADADTNTEFVMGLIEAREGTDNGN